MTDQCFSCDCDIEPGMTECPACGQDLSASGDEADLADIDMRQILDPTPPDMEVSTSRPGLVQTMAFPSARTSLDETHFEGFDPVRLKHRSGVVSANSNRRQMIGRAAPLLVVLVVGFAALGLVAYDLFAERHVPSLPVASASPVVALDGGIYTVGLTHDNKESVLQACYRLSNNPNYECRRDHLEDLGEYPSRQVHLPALEIDRFEVSNSDYLQCVESEACESRSIEDCRFFTHRGYQIDAAVPRRMLEANQPVICVTRREAEAFCRWRGGRLPTPDEWERAARGDDDRLSPWGELWAPNLMNWAETDMGGFPVVGRLDGYDLTAPVDSFEHGASPDGVRNMYGNVSEWVSAIETMPDGTRGGSYCNDLRDFRVTHQTPLPPTSRRSDVGFRCVYAEGIRF